MAITSTIYDAAHAYGLDNMSPTPELLNLNATIVGNLVSQTYSWGTGSLAVGSNGVITSLFSGGLTTKLSISNVNGDLVTLTYGQLFSTSTGQLLSTFSGSLTFSFSNFGTALQPENMYSGADRINGNSYANTLAGYGGDDRIDGGGGTDTAIFFGLFSSHSIQKSGAAILTDGPDGSDTMLNVERLQFDDKALAFDTDGSISAGGIYRLYQATFDRTPDLGGLGYWIRQADNGESSIRMAEDFTWSQEFQQLYGVSTHDNYQTGADIASLVSGFYQHVLHRAPDQGGLEYYVGVIESREKTVGQVLAEIADSPENYAATIGQIQNGIEYLPWAG